MPRPFAAHLRTRTQELRPANLFPLRLGAPPPPLHLPSGLSWPDRGDTAGLLTSHGVAALPLRVVMKVLPAGTRRAQKSRSARVKKVVGKELLCRENHPFRWMPWPEGDVCRRRCCVNSFDDGGGDCFDGCLVVCFSGRVKKNVRAGRLAGAWVLFCYFLFSFSSMRLVFKNRHRLRLRRFLLWSLGLRRRRKGSSRSRSWWWFC